MATDEPLIVKVLQSYYPGWDPPRDRGREWMKTLCPFHGESNPSASISFVHNAFMCFACGEKGDALAIIMRKEGMSYHQAIEYAETVSPGSHDKVRGKPARKPGRRVFGGAEADREGEGDGKQVPPRVRGRATPWT